MPPGTLLWHFNRALFSDASTSGYQKVLSTAVTSWGVWRTALRGSCLQSSLNTWTALEEIQCSSRRRQAQRNKTGFESHWGEKWNEKRIRPDHTSYTVAIAEAQIKNGQSEVVLVQVICGAKRLRFQIALKAQLPICLGFVFLLLPVIGDIPDLVIPGTAARGSQSDKSWVKGWEKDLKELISDCRLTERLHHTR